MVDWEHFAKPLGFVALYLAFAAAVRAVLKPHFPSGANYVFFILLIAGLALLYHLYYEAYYYVQEILLPSWRGEDYEPSDYLAASIEPILYVLGVLLLAGSLGLYLSSSGADPDFYPPLGLGLFFLVCGLVVTYSNDADGDAG